MRERESAYIVEDVVKAYKGREVLHIERLEILRGEVFSIVGPSGAGKSTLLRLLNFLEPPTHGIIRFGGYATNGSAPPAEVQRRITMLFQRPLLLSTTVYSNIAYGLRLRGERDAHTKIQQVAERLQLTPLLRHHARTLSDGELQRVALARAIVLEPEVLLLDEPTAHLDPYNVGLIEELIASVNREQGITVVLVTHNVLQAKRLAHRVALLLGGQIVEVNDVRQFFESPKDARTAAFVRGEMVW